MKEEEVDAKDGEGEVRVNWGSEWVVNHEEEGEGRNDHSGPNQRRETDPLTRVGDNTPMKRAEC